MATPQKTCDGGDTSHRLLYRGALSLPDSYLVLDGIAFSARLSKPGRATQDSPIPSPRADVDSARDLMHNPLALALESMRGRQTLRFKGTVSLRDVWMDDSGDVYMDIHPHATLTRIYFENTLCLAGLEGSGKRTQIGVRVALGDTDGPETTDIVIYGEMGPVVVSTEPELSVRVARITPVPRAPRPDDPTPRKPPVRLISGTSTLSELGANKRIVVRPGRDETLVDKGKRKEREREEDAVVRRAREVMRHLPRSNAVGGRTKSKEKGGGPNEGGFKVPELPAKARRKRGTDVFGVVEPPRSSRSSADDKGKGAVDGEADLASATEDANKLVLKKTAVSCLSSAGIPRSHVEFKDIFGFVYRGASFALRSQMKSSHVSAQAAEAVVEAHVKMYVSTMSHAASGTRGKLANVFVDDAEP